jgi:hypothetical protein
MDPLDQHLHQAGAAWRQSQQEAPDLARIVAGLDRRRPGRFSPRAMVLLAASLVLVAGLAGLAGAGGYLDTLRNGPTAPPATTLPARSASPSISEPAPPSGEPSSRSDAERATDLVAAYQASLVARRWQAAFDLLAPTSPTREAGYAAYATERAPYYESVAGRYELGAPTRLSDGAAYGPLIAGAELARAYLVEVDYPALSGNNAGYEQFVVAPDAGGSWRIWPVR